MENEVAHIVEIVHPLWVFSCPRFLESAEELVHLYRLYGEVLPSTL